MKRYIICSLLLLCSTAILAQTKSEPAGGGGFIIGYGHMDVSALHAFVPGSVGDFNDNHLVLGGTGHSYNNRLVLGGTGNGMVGSDITTDSLKIHLNGGVGTFDIGYMIFQRDQFKLYPLVGVGCGGYGMQITQSGNMNIDQVVEDPGREININSGGFIMDFSINVNVIPVLAYDTNSKGYGGLMTGCKIGYLYGFPNSTWTYSGGEISDGPEFNVSMFYVQFLIGGFGFGGCR